VKLGRSVQMTGWLLEHFPDLSAELGKLESRWLDSKLDSNIHNFAIQKPIYIGSLARSGSTILLESIVEHPSTISFAYRDFPFVYFPVWWRRLSEKIFDMHAPPTERAHGDRILVTPDSPEAFEEILWMYFFPQIHQSDLSQKLSGDRPDFESYYRATIQKLLWQSGASRYVAKGNYHISRIDYLSRLFPDAQFVIPVRHPLTQVASLLRQHKRFCHLENQDIAILKYMQRAGHFEFGLDRRPVNIGNPEDSRLIQQYFESGRDAEGYAEQWRVIYRYVNEIRSRANVKLVFYEQLCSHADDILSDLYQWLGLEASAEQHALWQQRFSLPEHRQPVLSPEDEQKVWQITGDVAQSLGYVLSSP
jgi:hypothetical protein